MSGEMSRLYSSVQFVDAIQDVHADDGAVYT